jgi:hypothetical protein
MKFDLLKRGSLLIFGAAIIVTAAHALTNLDVDSDGMSDVWEGQHGFATTGAQPADQLPTADPDGDGWTNLEESQAGTDPSSGVPPLGILKPTVLKHPDFPTVFVVSWPSIEGKQYRLFASSDLSPESWFEIDEPVMGTGSIIEYGTEALDEDGYLAERLFWRVSVTDVDSDGDTLTDWAELQLGYKPDDSDTDGDGLPDNTDPAALSNPAWMDRDGANLATSVNEGLLARWDFEGGGPDGVTLVSTPETGPTSAGPIDIADTGAGWDGRDDWPRAANGMPWACLHLTSANSHAKVPTTRLNHDTQTWAMWIKFPRATATSPGALDSSAGRRTLFAVGKDETLSSNDPGSRPIVQCYFDGKGTTTNSSDNRLILSNWSGGVENELASWTVPAALDDGQWHHVAIHFDDNDGGYGKYRAWYDGGAFDTTQAGTISGDVFTYSLTAAPHPWCYLGRFMKFIPPLQGHETLGAQIDRLRIYNKVLQPGDVLALYNQDIDGDGLTDRFESRTRFWRDHNHDKIDQQSETTFPVSPFRTDTVGSDHDGDGLSTHDEQTRGTNPWKADSDGDLLPDGWEVEHGNSPSDTDGLTALEEYRWGTDPNSSDTDLDGTSDSVEVSNGSHPNDASDGGQPVPSAERLTFRIEVGDESGSHSEDYVVQCRRIDPATGEEKHVYTVRSGGFGGHVDQNYSMFRKGVTYTFQLDWQGSSNATGGSGVGDGPDYDYTFHVLPQGDHGAALIDSWNKQNGMVDPTAPLQGDLLNDVASNEDAFREKVENRRVALVALKVEWESDYQDASMEDHVDPWGRGVNGKAWFPDSPNPKVDEYRDPVVVKVSQGLPHAKVWLRSFDVDDSTFEDFDTNLGIDPAVIDPNGASGGDNRTDSPENLAVPSYGRFTRPGGRSFGRFSGSFDSAGQLRTQFNVGISPGNNYRVAASMKSSALDELFVGVGEGSPDKMVTSNSSEKPDFSGAISPLLTIWRRLWLEIDSMGSEAAPPAGEENWIHGSLTSIASGTPLPPPAGSPPSAGTPLWDCVFDGAISRNLDEFENGWLIVGGTAHRVHAVVQWPSGELVARTLSNPGATGACTLLDDDNTSLPPSYSPILPRYGIDSSYAAAKFRPAFIKLIPADDEYNVEKEIPFKLNERSSVPLPGPFPVIWNNAQDLEDVKSHWVAHAVFGFQDAESKDCDPNSEENDSSSGETPVFRLEGSAPTDYSVIWLEQIRETFNWSWYSTDPGQVAQGPGLFDKEVNLTLLHEIGHQPAVNEIFVNVQEHHREGGIMKGGGSGGYDDNYTPATVKRFRRTMRWTENQEE